MSLYVMDGSMGRELMRNGVPEDTQIWSGRALMDPQYHPIVVRVHQQYISAGARSITTCNYPVQPRYYSRIYGQEEINQKMFEDTQTAAKLAFQARKEAPNSDYVVIAGSMPPMLETLRPDMINAYLDQPDGIQHCTNYYRLIAAAMADYVDVFHLETMNNWAEISCALEALKDYDKPIWIFLNGRMPDPETFIPRPHMSMDFVRKVLHLVRNEHKNIPLIGFNCAQPEDITAAFEAIPQSLLVELKKYGVGIGAYANPVNVEVMEKYDMQKVQTDAKRNSGVIFRKDITPVTYLEHIQRWKKLGATHVGGCCGIGPKFINLLVKTFMMPHLFSKM